MRASAVLVCALALLAGGCSDGTADGRSRWTGKWTLDRERSARSVLEFDKAERERILRGTEAGGPFSRPGGGIPREAPPSDEVMLTQRREWLRGMSVEVELRADGSARAEIYLGGNGAKTTYTGTWAEVGGGAEMTIVLRAGGALQGRDAVPLRFRRDEEFLVMGGETDAKGAPRPLAESNTVVTARAMYLSRK